MVYNWMDLGDVICEKLRSGRPLSEIEFATYNGVGTMVQKIKIDNTIQLYRGLTKPFDALIGEKQLNSTSLDLKTAQTYGSYIVKIVVPAGSSAFYLSAWQSLNTQVGLQEEKEVLLLPGKFTFYGEENGVSTYIYDEKWSQ